VDLNTGLRTAALTLYTAALPQSFISAADGGIWFIIYDEQYGCDVLYRWELSASKVANSITYTAAYFTPDYPDTEGLEACARLAQALGEQYGIEILVYDRADDVQPPDYRLVCEHLVPVIQRELKQLEQGLGSYPEGFIQALASRFDSLTICLVRSLAGSPTLGSLESTSGIQFWDGPHAYIALAAGSGSRQALYHEVCHLIDTVVLTQSSAYDTWNQLNPTGFSYDYDYIANQQRNSTAYLQDATRYFVDMYSMSFPKEDRARIMEYAMTEGNAHLFQTDAMRAKLETISRGIREAFGLEDIPEPFLWEQYLYSNS